MTDNAKPSELARNPVVHKAGGNPAAHKVALDIVLVAVHMVVEPDMAVVAVRKTEMGTVAGYMVEMGIEAAAAHIATDMQADCRVVMDIVDTVMMVVDIVVEDSDIDLILEHTMAGCVDPYRLLHCHSRHKIGHALHFVFHNFRTALPLFAGLLEHAHHDHTGYRTWCLLVLALDMQDKQSWSALGPE